MASPTGHVVNAHPLRSCSDLRKHGPPPPKTCDHRMSDLPDANWNISVAGKQATIKKDATTVTSYDLSSYSGTFSIAFDELGKPVSVPALPYSITMDAVTGFIP